MVRDLDLTLAVPCSPRGAYSFVVLGILQSRTYGWFRAEQDFVVAGKVLSPAGRHITRVAVCGDWWVDPSVRLFFTSDPMSGQARYRCWQRGCFATAPQIWPLLPRTYSRLIMQGTFFVISVFLQTIRNFSAIETGLILTPATIGILLASALSERMAKRRPQKLLIGGDSQRPSRASFSSSSWRMPTRKSSPSSLVSSSLGSEWAPCLRPRST